MEIAGVEINKKLFVTTIIVLVLSIIAFFANKFYVKRYERYKQNKKEDYIYLYDNYKDSKSYIPYINLKTDFAKDLNKEIQTLAKDYEDSDSSTYSMSYRYNVSQNIVSLVIILKNMNENDELQFDFITYVFDLKNGAKDLNSNEILEKFNMDEDDVRKNLEKQMKEKYDYEIEEEIIPDDCDFDNCFLSLRDIDDYLDNASYYIEDGQLVIYRPYKVYSKYNEEDIYTRDDFKFYIN